MGSTPKGVASVMLIGHNTAVQELAVMLAARGDRVEELAKKYPTAGGDPFLPCVHQLRVGAHPVRANQVAISLNSQLKASSSPGVGSRPW